MPNQIATNIKQSYISGTCIYKHHAAARRRPLTGVILYSDEIVPLKRGQDYE
jgi:hypothetical protein